MNKKKYIAALIPLLAIGLLFFSYASIPHAQAVTAGKIRIVYIKPSDILSYYSQGTIDSEIAQLAIDLAEIQDYYFDQLADGTTFALNDVIVQEIQSTQTEAWFRTNITGADSRYYFYLNAYHDYDGITPGVTEVNSSTDRYIIIVITKFAIATDFKAVTMAHEIGADPGNGAISVLSANFGGDLDNEAKTTIAHELGHTFGLNHSADGSIMESAFPDIVGTWPNPHFNSSDLASLRANPFFTNDFTDVPPTPRYTGDVRTTTINIRTQTINSL